MLVECRSSDWSDWMERGKGRRPVANSSSGWKGKDGGRATNHHAGTGVYDIFLSKEDADGGTRKGGSSS